MDEHAPYAIAVAMLCFVVCSCALPVFFCLKCQEWIRWCTYRKLMVFGGLGEKNLVGDGDVLGEAAVLFGCGRYGVDGASLLRSVWGLGL